MPFKKLSKYNKGSPELVKRGVTKQTAKPLMMTHYLFFRTVFEGPIYLYGGVYKLSQLLHGEVMLYFDIPSGSARQPDDGIIFLSSNGGDHT